jgi:hypothetical protein
MGGLLTGAAITDPGTACPFQPPFEEQLKVNSGTRELVREGLLYKPYTDRNGSSSCGSPVAARWQISVERLLFPTSSAYRKPSPEGCSVRQHKPSAIRWPGGYRSGRPSTDRNRQPLAQQSRLPEQTSYQKVLPSTPSWNEATATPDGDGSSPCG